MTAKPNPPASAVLSTAADLEKPKSQRALVRDLERQRRLILTGQGRVREALNEADEEYRLAMIALEAQYAEAKERVVFTHREAIDNHDRRMAELAASLAVCDAGIAAVKPALKLVEAA